MVVAATGTAKNSTPWQTDIGMENAPCEDAFPLEKKELSDCYVSLPEGKSQVVWILFTFSFLE